MDFNNLDQDWCFANTEVMAGFADLLKRVMALEQQVANQAVKIRDLHEHLGVKRFDEHALKSQAAQQQAQPRFGTGGSRDANNCQLGPPLQQNHYAPLRSDTKPLIEMAAFVREIAMFNPDATLDLAFSVLIREAQEILKRST